MSRRTLVLGVIGLVFVLGYVLAMGVYEHFVLPAYAKEAAQTLVDQHKQAEAMRHNLEVELQRWADEDRARHTGWITERRSISSFIEKDSSGKPVVYRRTTTSCSIILRATSPRARCRLAHGPKPRWAMSPPARRNRPERHFIYASSLRVRPSGGVKDEIRSCTCGEIV